MSTQTPAGKPAKPKQRRPRPNPEALSNTVPELAAEMRCGRDKILHLIKTGQLVAYDLSSNPNGLRARWSVLRTDWLAFLESRRAVPVSPAPVRRKKSDCPRYV